MTGSDFLQSEGQGIRCQFSLLNVLSQRSAISSKAHHCPNQDPLVNHT
uniref:Uncharacterized protein n=1 Tax=Picea sitchensis TaxID=3332 RepID=A9NXT7_PICSI|nr:unknown [Picea sitchensis]